MYLPAHFEEKDEKEIFNLIEQFPLATMVCHLNDELVANHIPLFHDKDDLFIGHIAKANSLHEHVPERIDAIAIFKSEDAYISPNWYPTKKETHRHVPTWNYQVVHLHGQVQFDHSKKAKLAAVGKLTKIYERMHSGDDEWKMSDAPKDYMEGMLENIVAFTLKANRISAKTKVGQNREKIDFDSVVEVMEKSGKSRLSNAMRRYRVKS